jgi:hypothetical protein
MIKLKRLILENQERKYILPPSGDIFQVNDHVGWAARNILKQKYGHLSGKELGDVIENVYDDMEKLGYKIMVWAGSNDTLYLRGDNAIKNLTASQRRRIGDLAIKLADEGIYYNVTLEDDGGHFETLWSHHSI